MGIGLSLALAAAVSGEISFERIWFEGSPYVYSTAYDVSSDGSVVVGFSLNPDGNNEAFRWDNGVLSGLGFLEGSFNNSIARTVSGDGSKVAGGSGVPFWWENNTLTPFADKITEGVLGEILAMSADGSVVVGRDRFLPNNVAVRWEGGKAVALPYLDEVTDNSAVATDVSANGAIVVGYSGNETRKVAFRYVSPETVALSPLNPEDTDCRAMGISADGGTIVGSNTSASGETVSAVFWRNNEVVELPNLDPGLPFQSSMARSASGDGSVIVGHCYSVDSFLGNIQEAVMWTRQGDGSYDVMSLNDLLDANSIPRNNYILRSGVAISTDGTTIVGSGKDIYGTESAFRLRLGDPVLTWAGYPVHPDGRSVDTGNFIGWIDIGDEPWLYSYSLSKYIFGQEGFVTASGGWFWIGK